MLNINNNLLKNSENARGFTLLELSVVIAIIALLIGGLVGANAYVKASELKSLVNESKYYMDAFGQFQTLYTAVPGDMVDATKNWGVANTADGDGNGYVRAGATAQPRELFLSFQHLAKAGLISGSYTGLSKDGTTTTALADPGVNVPNAVMTGAVYLFDHPDAVSGEVAAGDPLYFASATAGLYSHVLRVAGLSATANGLPAVGFLTPKQAYQLDAKFDDGVPSTGWMLTPNNTGAQGLPNCSNGTTYTVANLGTECFFILRMQ